MTDNELMEKLLWIAQFSEGSDCNYELRETTGMIIVKVSEILMYAASDARHIAVIEKHNASLRGQITVLKKKLAKANHGENHGPVP